MKKLLMVLADIDDPVWDTIIIETDPPQSIGFTARIEEVTEERLITFAAKMARAAHNTLQKYREGQDDRHDSR